MEDFITVKTTADFLDTFQVKPDRDGGIYARIRMESFEDGSKLAASIVLPASDARRLRDWLNERYPDEEKG